MQLSALKQAIVLNQCMPLTVTTAQSLQCRHASIKAILQAPLVDKSRPLGASMPFMATTTAKADYTAPTKRAERHQRAKAELVPGAPLTNATMYRWGCWRCHLHAIAVTCMHAMLASL